MENSKEKLGKLKRGMPIAIGKGAVEKCRT